jgi:hypothetical protein
LKTTGPLTRSRVGPAATAASAARIVHSQAQVSAALARYVAGAQENDGAVMLDALGTVRAATEQQVQFAMRHVQQHSGLSRGALLAVLAG